MEEWSHRLLDPVYVAIFIDAIVVKVRDGQVANRPVYAAIGVTLEGRKDVLGLTMGTGGGEGAKFWMSVLVGLKEPRRARRVFPRLRWPGKVYPRWWTTSGHTLSCKRASFI
jgi:transposase-like protein